MCKNPLFLSLLIVSLAVFLFSAGPLLADEILLQNGDRLTGTLVKAEGGKVTLKTDYAGEIQIPVEKIKKLSTDEPNAVHLRDGEVLKGRLETVAEGKLAVEPSPDREAAIIEWKKVASINPSPKKWKGSIHIGANSQSGNSDTIAASVGAEAVRKTEQDRFSLRFLFNYAKDSGEVKTRNTYGALKYDYFLTRRFYSYLALALLNDKFQDLHLRTTIGPGVGYQIWDDPVKSMHVEAGASYVWTDYYEAQDIDYPAARLGGEFRFQPFKFLAFSDGILVYPSLKYGREYTLRNEAALTSPLGSGWALRLSNIWERNSDPPKGKDKDDFTTTLGLQYSF